MKMIIEMQDMENYAAHSDDWNGTDERWKYKIGTTYVINNIQDYYDGDHMEVLEEVGPFINSDSNSFKSWVVGYSFLEDDEDTEYVKQQKEYEGDWGTIYLPTELKQNSKGVWFQKRGYIVGKMSQDTYPELVGKFVGWVDNLLTGKCVMKIEGDSREAI
jgi:hypothetical protein